MRELEFSKPAEIEAESFAIIGRELEEMGVSLAPEEEPVVKRAIHATADFDYAKNLVFTPGAVQAALEALRAGTAIVTDTSMARAGLNTAAMERLGVDAHCFISRPEVVRRAMELGTTRAVAALEWGRQWYPRAVYVVGNAPTALVKLEELILEGAIHPALIVAVPVGFVNVVESKQRIFDLALERGIPAIAALGRKGGSTVAAAVCNALLYQAGGRDGK